ncbi:hypothetical protein VNO78_32405 [Psophocarpus tetragonolobus]|uniref:Uncharacterized protein n=1 Tax=Psophocarpus tetragonolobus TaxID=3891 RepID=A0AAN9P0J9_PSOTE
MLNLKRMLHDVQRGAQSIHGMLTRHAAMTEQNQHLCLMGGGAIRFMVLHIKHNAYVASSMDKPEEQVAEKIALYNDSFCAQYTSQYYMDNSSSPL